MAPSFGCTEPAGTAYLGSLASLYARGRIKAVNISADINTVKNTLAVYYPAGGRKFTGLEYAAALGLKSGDYKRGLQCLSEASTEGIIEAVRLVASGVVKVLADRDSGSYRVSVEVRSDAGAVNAAAENSHLNVTALTLNGRKVDFKSPSYIPVVPSGFRAGFSQMLLAAHGADRSDLAVVRKIIGLNMEAMKESCRRGYAPPRLLKILKKRNASCAEAGLLLKGAVEMRMNGEAVPVYAVSGSGNTGLSLTLPLMYSPFGKKGGDRLKRAFILASLVNSRVRESIGITGPLCSAYLAGGAGLCSAYGFLSGAEPRAIEAGAALFILSAQGLFCNGAGPLCPGKLSTMPLLAFNCSAAYAGGKGCRQNGALSLDKALKGLEVLMKSKNTALNRDITVMMKKLSLKNKISG